MSNNSNSGDKNIKSDQGGNPLNQSGGQISNTGHRIGDADVGQVSNTRPPRPPKPQS